VLKQPIKLPLYSKKATCCDNTLFPLKNKNKQLIKKLFLFLFFLKRGYIYIYIYINAKSFSIIGLITNPSYGIQIVHRSSTYAKILFSPYNQNT
jgi:hypothetical protein